VDKNMALNGTEFINNPWNTTFSPWTDLFNNMVGNGNVFYLFPLIILTIGVYIKTQSATMTSLFMIATGALCGTGSFFTGASTIALMFVIFTAIGFVGLFIGIIFQR